MNPKVDVSVDLTFDASFESANLDLVLKPAPLEYDLFMRVDTNTKGHHQWFYFSVSYKSDDFDWDGRIVKFNVCNFTKPLSLFTYGMRICVARKSNNYTWVKEGDNITYGRSKTISKRYINPPRVKYFSQLSFELMLTEPEDEIFLAYCYPYTFS